MKLSTKLSDPKELEEALAGQLRFRRWIPTPQRQYRVLDHRKYVWDFAWPAHRLAVEVDGGTWTGGAHVRGNGYERDCEKQNLAVIAGWRTMRFTAGQVRSEMAVEMIARALGVECNNGPRSVP